MNYNEMAMERHTGTLKRMLAILLVYIGVADDDAQAMRFIGRTASDWDIRSGGGGADAVTRAFAAMGDPRSISRRLHGMIRKLLLPMEAATRRLIIVLAAELPDPKIVPSMLKVRRRVASTIKLVTLPRTWQAGVMVPRFLQPAPPPPSPAFKPPARIPRFALLDPLKRFGRRRSIRNTCPPRIAGLGENSVLSPVPVHVPQSPWDQISDARLMRRVTALASALDNLPRQAQRLARWRALTAARRAAGLRGRGKFLAPVTSRCAPARHPVRRLLASRRTAIAKRKRSSPKPTAWPAMRSAITTRHEQSRCRKPVRAKRSCSSAGAAFARVFLLPLWEKVSPRMRSMRKWRRMRGAGQSAKLEHPSSAFTSFRHLLPQGEKESARIPCYTVRMTLEEYNRFCGSLPHTSHVVQWGGSHVWKVAGKLFAVAGWDDGTVVGYTFKTSEMSYDLLKDVPGCRPAPYLASRGMKWIQRTGPETLDDAALRDYLAESHRLVAAGLPKKLRQSLGLV